MAYFHKVLQPDETVRAIARMHWLIFWPAILWALIAIAIALVGLLVAVEEPQRNYCFYAAAAIAVVALIMFLEEFVRRQGTEVVVTDKRVIFKRGFLSRFTAEMNVSKIETVDVEQTLAGRLFGYGTLVIRGTGAGIEPLRFIGSPIGVRNAILMS